MHYLFQTINHHLVNFY